MRSDVAKVISERAKSGRTWVSKTPRRGRVIFDTSGEPIAETKIDKPRTQTKYTRLRRNVIERFLVRKIGQPWSAIHSEACAKLDSRTYHGLELRYYLQDLVAAECWSEGRNILYFDASGASRIVDRLYVHPTTKLLCRPESREVSIGANRP